MRLDYIRSEIERMRIQVYRQRTEIRQLERAGIATTSAEALLDRMLGKIDELCAERDRQLKEQKLKFLAPTKLSTVPRNDNSDELVRRQCGASALDESLGRGPALSGAGGLVLPPRPGNYCLDRPVR